MGEELAVKYLLERSYRIIRRNYRYHRDEIDIIASISDCIHFVEVKYRSSNDFGFPENFVSNAQKERIKEAAEDFMISYRWGGNIRFDIISIENTDNGYRIEHIEDAF